VFFEKSFVKKIGTRGRKGIWIWMPHIFSEIPQHLAAGPLPRGLEVFFALKKSTTKKSTTKKNTTKKRKHEQHHTCRGAKDPREGSEHLPKRAPA
jgi:hypothetical protein